MQTPPRCGENLNAGPLLADKRISAVFEALRNFSMGFPVELPGRTGPSPARWRAGRGQCGRSPTYLRAS